MFDGYNSCHTISNICTGKINILILKNSKLSRIIINNCRKHSLKPCYVGTALLCINVVTEAKYVLLKFIDILKSHFNNNIIGAALKGYYLMNRLFILIKVLYKA